LHLLDDILDPALVKVFELLKEGRVAAEYSGNGAGPAYLHTVRLLCQSWGSAICCNYAGGNLDEESGGNNI